MVPRNSSALPVKVRRQESKRKAVVSECGEERRERLRQWKSAVEEDRELDLDD